MCLGTAERSNSVPGHVSWGWDLQGFAKILTSALSAHTLVPNLRLWLSSTCLSPPGPEAIPIFVSLVGYYELSTGFLIVKVCVIIDEEAETLKLG